MVPTLTIDPRPAALMCGTAARVMFSAPCSTMSIERRSCLSGVARRSWKPGCEYAELTSPVTAPNRSTAVRTTGVDVLGLAHVARHADRLATRRRDVLLHLRPSPAVDRAAMTTFAPSAAARAASFAPSPAPTPEMITTSS